MLSSRSEVSVRTLRTYRLELFGGPRLMCGDREVALSPYELALLSIVFSQSTAGIPRAAVAELLWGRDGPVARHRLSQTLYSLARKLKMNPVRGVSNRLIPGAGVECDVSAVLDPAAAGDLRSAAQLVSKGFLRSLPAVPTIAFQEWMDEQDAGFRAMIRAQARSEWSKCASEGRWESALDAAEALRSLDPLDKAAVQYVMTATAMRGNVEGAEEVYRLYIEALAALGGERESPAAELQDLAALIREFRAVGDGRSAKRGEGVQETIGLVGRQSELRRLRDALLSQGKSGVSFIALAGEGGIGKTRLIVECLREVRLKGGLVLASKASELERDIPLSALLDSLSHALVAEAIRSLGDPWRVVLLTLLPELAEPSAGLTELPVVQPAALQRRLFEAIRQLFAVLTRDSEVLLVIDDFQWADETSIAALEYIRRRLQEGVCRVLLAFRPEEIAPDSTAARFVRAVRETSGDVVISVEELSKPEARQLVGKIGGLRIPARVASWICDLGGGNPFFLIESSLEYLAGHLAPPLELHQPVPVPVSIALLLEQRLMRLSSPAARLLGALAAIGRPAPAREIACVAKLTRAESIEAFEELYRARLIQWDERKAVPRHELIRQAVYRSLSEERMAWLHNRIAMFLARCRVPMPVDELAIHCDLAGQRARAYEFSSQAARRAEEIGAMKEAAHFLAIAHRNAPNERDAADIVAKLARVHYLQLDFQAAAPLLDLAVRRFTSQNRRREALLAEVWRLDALSRRDAIPISELLEQLSVAKEEARHEGEWEIVASVVDLEWRLLDRVGETIHVTPVVLEAEKCVERGDAKAKCAAHRTLAWFHQYYGDPRAALAHCVAAVSVAEEACLEWDLLRGLNAEIGVLTLAGRLQSAKGREVIDRADGLAARSGDLLTRFSVSTNVGVWYLDIGELADAEQHFGESERIIGDAEALPARITLCVNLGELYYELRRIEEARRYYQWVLDLTGVPIHWYGCAAAQAGMGMCAFHEGDLREVRKWEQLLSEIVRGKPRWPNDPCMIVRFQAELAHRRRDTSGAVRILEEAAERVRGRLIPNWIKLEIEAARLMGKMDRGAAAAIALPAFKLARQLGLERRCEQLDAFVVA